MAEVCVCRATKVEREEAETQLVDSFDLREAQEYTGAACVSHRVPVRR